jgi:hypothetical protein
VSICAQAKNRRKAAVAERTVKLPSGSRAAGILNAKRAAANFSTKAKLASRSK